jgi:hypothetical protein
MSERNNQMGKTYSSVSEAFKDADYASCIQKPKENDYDWFGACMGVLFFLLVFGYGIYKTTGG